MGTLVAGFLDWLEFDASEGVEFIPYPHVDGEHAGKTYLVAPVRPGEKLILRAKWQDNLIGRIFSSVVFEHA